MTSKERVNAVLEGKPVDRCPITVPYVNLYHRDHFSELTGKPQWHVHKWLNAEPDEYVRLLKQLVNKVSFEIVEPQHTAPLRRERANVEFVEKDGTVFRHVLDTNQWEPLVTASGHANDYCANETQYVFDNKDIDERVKLITAEQRLATGVSDYIEATVEALGREHFILSGGVCGIPYSCHCHVGLTNIFSMMIEHPGLIEYLGKKILENNIEEIRRLAIAGGDAIYIDDATSTCDMISVKHYEQFSLPHMKEMVREIHNLGKKAILIYFGGIADRLDQIASIGADGLIMETSMKNYVNDVGEVARRIGYQITLFGNIDPLGILEHGTDKELEAEMRRQAEAADAARGFIMSTGSPITPGTPLERIQRYLELGRII